MSVTEDKEERAEVLLAICSMLRDMGVGMARHPLNVSANQVVTVGDVTGRILLLSDVSLLPDRDYNSTCPVYFLPLEKGRTWRSYHTPVDVQTLPSCRSRMFPMHLGWAVTDRSVLTLPAKEQAAHMLRHMVSVLSAMLTPRSIRFDVVLYTGGRLGVSVQDEWLELDKESGVVVEGETKPLSPISFQQAVIGGGL